MEIWHKSFRDKLYRLALRLLNSSEEAADVAQEVWARLWQKRAEIPKLDNAESFAFTMTRNLCFDVLKSARMKNERLDTMNVSTIAGPQIDSMESNEKLALVHQAINKLSEQQKIVIQLRDIEGYELSEIAQMLDLTPNNTKVILCRARQNVRQTIINFELHEQETYSGLTR
ncbi:MAG: sigma-70 family RNA polymerase sigma factor [Bacteroidota bacterium]|nr:sigma-70 family RNA polymerase sigma factor [Bacteroidota bacterium]